MVARPKSEIWRTFAQAVAQRRGRGSSFWQRVMGFRSRQIHADGLPSAVATPPTWWFRTRSSLATSRLQLNATLDRLKPGGKAMIFRKDNRGESFQRQISNLRNPIQPEEETASDDYEFDQPQDTSQFSSATGVSRDESYAAPRTTDLPGAGADQAAAAGYRGSWQTADTNTSVIAANAHWNGTLRSEGSLHIHGRADGELHATNDLFVAEGAETDAQLFADNVVVAGVVRGRIEARSRLEVLPQGHVAGDVKSPKLVVHEGARLTGQLKMEAGSGRGSGPAQYSTSAPAPKSRRGQNQR